MPTLSKDLKEDWQIQHFKYLWLHGFLDDTIYSVQLRSHNKSQNVTKIFLKSHKIKFYIYREKTVTAWSYFQKNK